jgi:hypothetical protein
MAEFRQYVESFKPAIKIDEEAWKTDQNFIRAMVRFEIDLDLFGVEAAWRNLVKLDPQLQYSLDPVPRSADTARYCASGNGIATRVAALVAGSCWTRRVGRQESLESGGRGRPPLDVAPPRHLGPSPKYCGV